MLNGTKKIIAVLLTVIMLFGLSTIRPFTLTANAATISVGDSAALTTALNNAANGDTIKLTANINHNNGILIDGKNITIDTSSFKLNVENKAADGAGLEVKNGGRFDYSGTGSVNITGVKYGVTATGGGYIRVTNATATGADGIGVHTGFGNAFSHVKVENDVKSACVGVSAGFVRLDGGINRLETVIVGGNVEVTTSNAKNVGVSANIGAMVKINGILIVPKPGIYITMSTWGINGFEPFEKSDGWPGSGTYKDYLVYEESHPNDAMAGIVYIKNYICEYVDTGELLLTLDDALMYVEYYAGGTVRLLSNVDYNKTFTVPCSCFFTLDLDGYTLNVNGGKNTGLVVEEDAGITLSNPYNGIFNVSGANGANIAGSAEMTNVTATGIAATNYGVRVQYVGYETTATVYGEITVSESANYVMIHNKPEAKSSFTTPTTKPGFYTYGGGDLSVWVKNHYYEVSNSTDLTNALKEINTLADGSAATIKLIDSFTHNNGINVNKKIIVFDLNNKILDIVNKDGTALFVQGKGQVKLDNPSNGQLNLTGKANVLYTLDGKTEITNIKNNGTGATDYAIYAVVNSEVTVHGTITVAAGAPYIYVGANEKTKESGIKDASNPGFLKYADGTCTVWVKAPTTNVTFTAQQTGGASGTVDSTGIKLIFSQTISGLTADKITITNGTGAVTKGALSGSGTTYTIALTSISTQGNVTVNVANFGEFTVTTPPQTVAVYKSAAPTYTVTVNSGTGGGSFAEGATVNITANTAPDGKAFDKWTTSDGVTFANANNASTTFVMPKKAVTVTANYKNLPVNTFNITIQNDGNGTANANVNFSAAGEEITLTAVPKTGYNFKEWQVINGGVTIANNKFIMPANAVTIKAVFEPVNEILKGDINNDGKVNGMDLLLMKQHILAVPGKNIEPGTNAFKAADINDDGKINGMDLLLLKKKILF